ncbi:MAG: methyl-accepting chemotaxis protein [Xanthobacteraceae bacterium]
MELKDVLGNIVNLSMSSVDVSVTTAHILSHGRGIQSAATSMAGAIEELSISIGEIENSAQRSSQAAHESSELTGKGIEGLSSLRNQILDTRETFGAIAGKIAELRGVVANLGKVVDLISKIAAQTNLLALNATIEAARAGDHGRGFAVVASEVKSLSRQTSESTDTIRKQIDTLGAAFSQVIDSVAKSETAVDTVVSLAENVGQRFEAINDNATSISGKVTELAEIISQQKLAVGQLSQHMSVVKDQSNNNLEAVENLANQSDRTVQLVETWRAELAVQDIENKVIYLAKADHLLWKKRLLDMALGRSNLKASELTDHTLCRLGKWYYSPDNRMKNLPSFVAIEAPHKKVHYHGIEAAKRFEIHQLDEGMAHFRKLEEASTEVLRALTELERQTLM